MNKITLELRPIEKPTESLRIKKENGAEVIFYDPEEASDFLKSFFGFSDTQIKEYWQV